MCGVALAGLGIAHHLGVAVVRRDEQRTTSAGDGVTGLSDGRLADIAPTLLQLMGLRQPQAMTGRPLLRRAAERATA